MKLKNGEIYNAVDKLNHLITCRLPVRTSLEVAKLTTRLNGLTVPLNQVRDNLKKQYHIKFSPNGDGTVKVEADTAKNLDKFREEMTTLMEQESEELEISKIKLPEKVASACDKCHHNMDKELEIEPVVLMALDKFVEV
jgi:hypothetical protein